MKSTLTTMMAIAAAGMAIQPDRYGRSTDNSTRSTLTGKQQRERKKKNKAAKKSRKRNKGNK